MLSNYGVQKLTFISRDSDKTATAQSVNSIDFNGLETPLIQQKSGNNAFPVAVGTGEAESTITATISQYNKSLFEVLAPKEAIITSDDSSTPSITSENLIGSSLLNVATGLILGLKSGSEASLKNGSYYLIAVSSSTVNVIPTSKDFETKENGVLNETPIAITAGVAVDVVNTVDGNSIATGLEFTGGSGAISFVVGDTIRFTVSKGKVSFNFSLMGQGGYTPRIFDLIVKSSEYLSNGKKLFTQTTIPKIAALKNPFGSFARLEFSDFELTMIKLSSNKLEDKMNTTQIEV